MYSDSLCLITVLMKSHPHLTLQVQPNIGLRDQVPPTMLLDL